MTIIINEWWRELSETERKDFLEEYYGYSFDKHTIFEVDPKVVTKIHNKKNEK